MKYTFLQAFFLTFVFVSCNETATPKPDGFLSLEYPEAHYSYYTQNKCGFKFEKNNIATIVLDEDCAFKIDYPQMKASIYIDYKPVQNNLESLLVDAQKLTYNHTIRAEEIIEHPYVNPDKKVYGMFYNVTGDAATNIQFYATDSVKNFVVGTLYFYAKPNYDSIYPATKYVEKDMILLMESIEWK